MHVSHSCEVTTSVGSGTFYSHVLGHVSPVGHGRAWGEMPGDPLSPAQAAPPTASPRSSYLSAGRSPNSVTLANACARAGGARESGACASCGRPAPGHRWHRWVLGNRLSNEAAPGAQRHPEGPVCSLVCAEVRRPGPLVFPRAALH